MAARLAIIVAPTWRPLALRAAGVAAGLAATVALTFPYLSVVEQNRAASESANPVVALTDFATAADLNPWSATPGRAAGNLALSTGQYEVAIQRFRQSIGRQPDGWFSWLGEGLAASELGEVARARRDFTVAARLDPQQPAVTTALRRVGTANPLSASEAIKMLIIVQ